MRHKKEKYEKREKTEIKRNSEWDDVDKHSYHRDYSGQRSFEEPEEAPKEIEKPNFEPSGLLAEETNTLNGVVLKFNLPSDSRPAPRGWKLYMFKGSVEEQQPRVYPLEGKSSFIIGKDGRVADVHMLHLSISRQHAVIQFRFRPEKDTILPFIMDLESGNGTFLNDEILEKSRYYELRIEDRLRVGTSTREFIILHDSAVESSEVELESFAKEQTEKRVQEIDRKQQDLIRKREQTRQI